MNRIITQTIGVALVCVLLCAGTASAQFLKRFEMRDVVFAPGAGVGSDSALVIFQLAEPAADVSVIVFETDSITPVDTLRAPGPESSTASFFLGWRGTVSGGGLAPEGRYVITLSATDTAGTDTTVSRPVFIDVTPPSIEIQSISPSPYAPAVPGQSNVLIVRFNLTNVSPPNPDRSPDEIQVTFHNTKNREIEPDSLSFFPPLASKAPLQVISDGLYEMRWNASGQTTDLEDGDQRVNMWILDDAGFSSTVEQYFDVDKANPRVEITSPKTDRSWMEVPDSIFGFTTDRNGIDSLRVKFRSKGPLIDVTPSAVSGDTLFFGISIADSFTTEGKYKVTVRAVDGVGRVGSRVFSFSYDITPSTAPSLDPFSGPWYKNTFVVTGDAPDGEGPGSVIHLFRNGAMVDSIIVISAGERFSRKVSLMPGTNLLTATLVDEAGNESPPSNTVTVKYDASSGIVIPEPFVAGDEFSINASELVTGVSVRIYDIRGDFVVELEDSGPADTNWVLPWDGRNETAIPVRKGPLVAVIQIRFASGSKETTREIFLFEAHP